MAHITTIEQLRTLYAAPRERALRKALPRLDIHCRSVIGLSPLVMMGTFGTDGKADVSPRGEGPGFVHVVDDNTLLLPDRPGNNRLDSLTNLLANPFVGLLFLVPGIDETLRVNGTAEIRDDDDLLALFEIGERRPASVLRIHVEEAYLHCAKAFMRSRAWDAATHPSRDALPSMGEMLRDQLNLAVVETQAEMLERYRATLY